MDQKEALRLKRKETYQKAKAKRDADPRFIALKEKLKQDRKAKYRAFKDAQKQANHETKQKKVAEKDAALMTLVMKGSGLNKLPDEINVKDLPCHQLSQRDYEREMKSASSHHQEA